MRTFNYSKISENKWDSELLGLIAAIYKEAGKQELYLKQRPEELEKLVEIAKIQSTEASNAIEALERAIKAHGASEIINSDQGCQYTSKELLEDVHFAYYKKNIKFTTYTM